MVLADTLWFVVIKEYLFDHGPDSGWQLIEPVDGFHPNQVSSLVAVLSIRMMGLIVPQTSRCRFRKVRLSQPPASGTTSS